MIYPLASPLFESTRPSLAPQPATCSGSSAPLQRRPGLRRRRRLDLPADLRVTQSGRTGTRGATRCGTPTFEDSARPLSAPRGSSVTEVEPSSSTVGTIGPGSRGAPGSGSNWQARWPAVDGRHRRRSCHGIAQGDRGGGDLISRSAGG